MPLTLYFHPLSQPSRAVWSLLVLGKVEFIPKIIDLMKQENLTPEYTAITPTQAVPAIDDNGFKLFESHAILRYLACKYKIAGFYPQDPQQAALIECYLDWHHTGTRIIAKFMMDFVFGPSMFNKPAPENREERIKELEGMLQFLEYVFLGEGKYTYIHNQPHPTIADLSCIFDLIGAFSFNYDFSKFPGLKKYIQTMLAIPEMKEINKPFFEFLTNSKQEFNEFIKQSIHQ